MLTTRHRFALVLAAGDGTRVRSLTIDAEGVSVPKQYCALSEPESQDGLPAGRSLLRTTITRAERIAPRSRIVTVVASQHQTWWQKDLSHLPAKNAIVQPANRGTAPGILLPLLEIVRRDPNAVVLVLPSDHFVADEETLARAALRAIERAEHEPGRIVLLGITPERADSDLGWVTPGASRGSGIYDVSQFVEKPEAALARELIGRGALWNSFLFAARAETLLRRFELRIPGLVATLAAGVEGGRLESLYATLPTHDFSRRIFEGDVRGLSVLAVPPCGWSDLGTPERIAIEGKRLVAPAPHAAAAGPPPSPPIERPEVWSRLQLAF